MGLFIILFPSSKTSSQLLTEVNCSSDIWLLPIFLESSATIQQHVFYKIWLDWTHLLSRSMVYPDLSTPTTLLTLLPLLETSFRSHGPILSLRLKLSAFYFKKAFLVPWVRRVLSGLGLSGGHHWYISGLHTGKGTTKWDIRAGQGEAQVLGSWGQ